LAGGPPTIHLLLRLEGGIAHPELGPNMLGEKFQGGAIDIGIGVYEITHGLHKQALAFDVRRI
jgi:hypothetical protein